MNVHTTEKKTIVIKTEFVKYNSVLDLFQQLYNINKMFNAEQHLDYCYCNEKKTQCWLCKFSEYVKYNEFGDHLLRFRENEYRLLNVAEKFWFYISKIKRDIEREETDERCLEFFNEKFKSVEMVFDDIIKNDIKMFNEKYMK